MDSKPLRSCSEPGRTRQRTRKPCARSARMTALPTKPVPPVTNTRCATRRIVARAGAPRFSRGGVPTSPYHRAMRVSRDRAPGPACCLLPRPWWSRPPSPSRPRRSPGSSVDEAVRDSVAASESPGRGAARRARAIRSCTARSSAGARPFPHPELMTADTIFDIASLTKVVATTPSVLRLWEMGKVDLNAPLGRYLKEFDTPAFQDVTVLRLLTHSAGMPDLPSREAMAKGFPEAGAHPGAGRALACAPGTTFLYSDTGFILLGELVRRVSGEPLDRFAQKQLLRPARHARHRVRPARGLAQAHRAHRGGERRTGRSAAWCTTATRGCCTASRATRACSRPRRPEPVLPHAAGGRRARRPALSQGGHRAGDVRART